MKQLAIDIKSWGGILNVYFMEMLDNLPDEKCYNCRLAGLNRELDVSQGRDWYCAMYGIHISTRQCDEIIILKWLMEAV